MPNRADDDPTRALDDFVRRMRPATAPPAVAPDLSDLTARLQPDRGVTAARAKGVCCAAASVGTPTMSKTYRWLRRASRPSAATSPS